MAATHPAVTIRQAFPDDGLALTRLAGLDEAEPLEQPVLVAEVDGELCAALSLRDGRVIADPFRRTVALAELLLARAVQLTEDETPPARRSVSWSPGVLRMRLRGSA